MKQLIRYLPLLVLISSTQFASAFYDPDVQRWINRDPLGDFGFKTLGHLIEDDKAAGQRAYCFVLNDPLNSIDAYGLAVTGSCLCSFIPCTVSCACIRFDLSLTSYQTELSALDCLTRFCLRLPKLWPIPLIE